MAESYADLLKRSLTATTRLKTSAESLKAKITAGSVESSHVFTFYESLQSVWEMAAPLVTHDDLNGLAAANIVDPPEDTETMVSTGHAAGEQCALWIEANLPSDDGNLLGFTIDTDTNKLVYPTYTGEQLSGLSSKLDALIAAID